MDSEKLECILKEKCKKREVISFDLFDTILKRDVFSPVDVFSLVEKEADGKMGIRSGFSERRKKTEYELRKARNLQEVTLDEIYQVLNYPEEQKSKMKQLELEAESRLLHANYMMKRVFDFCIESNKQVYFISDMYLPLPFISGILHREGFDGYKKIYLSCEYKKTKLTGQLFRCFLEEEGIRSKDVLHIGDSLYADVIGAGKVGIKSYRIPTFVKDVQYIPVPDANSDLADRSLYSFINTHENKLGARPEKIGYELLGPLIFGYCSYLHNLPLRDGRKIWMAARDMYLFEKAYRMLYPEDDIEYIYLSRRSLRPVYTDVVGDLTKAGEAFPDKNYTLYQIVKYMGYNPDEFSQNFETAEHDKLYNGRKLGEYQEVKKLLSSPVIVEQEATLAKLGYSYLRSKGLFSDDIILADVGWHGTTQLLLEQIRAEKGENKPLYGCYIGSCEGTTERIGEHYCNWIFNEDDNRPFMRGIVLLESMILAPHGSTLRFVEGKGGRAEPVLGKPDNVSETIQQMQNGAMKFINEFKDSLLSNCFELSASIVCSGFEKLETEPQKEELKYIGDLDYENFYMTKIASPKRLRYYLIHIRELKRDFMLAGWRTGFLYRLFRVRLPYAKVYEIGRIWWRWLSSKSLAVSKESDKK